MKRPTLENDTLAKPIDCEPCQRMMSGYIDGVLGAELSVAVRSHMVTCEECRAECEQLARVRLLLRASTGRRASHEFWDRAYDRLRASESGPRFERRASGRSPIRLTPIGGAVRVRLSNMIPAIGACAAAAIVTVALGWAARVSQFDADSSPESRASRASIARTACSNDRIATASLVAIHTSEDESDPLADTGRLLYASSQANEADLSENGKQDIK